LYVRETCQSKGWSRTSLQNYRSRDRWRVQTLRT
jgi:hypothetical protein